MSRTIAYSHSGLAFGNRPSGRTLGGWIRGGAVVCALTLPSAVWSVCDLANCASASHNCTLGAQSSGIFQICMNIVPTIRVWGFSNIDFGDNISAGTTILVKEMDFCIYTNRADPIVRLQLDAATSSPATGSLKLKKESKTIGYEVKIGLVGDKSSKIFSNYGDSKELTLSGSGPVVTQSCTDKNVKAVVTINKDEFKAAEQGFYFDTLLLTVSNTTQ